MSISVPRVALSLAWSCALSCAAWAYQTRLPPPIAKTASLMPKYWVGSIRADVSVNTFLPALRNFYVQVRGKVDEGPTRCLFSEGPGKGDCGPRMASCEQLEIQWQSGDGNEHPRISLWAVETNGSLGRVYNDGDCGRGASLETCLAEQIQLQDMANHVRDHDRCCHKQKNCEVNQDQDFVCKK
jgi:hypothetical protein